MTLKLGTELQCKTGRIDANGDSWLHIGKNGGAGLSKSWSCESSQLAVVFDSFATCHDLWCHVICTACSKHPMFLHRGHSWVPSTKNKTRILVEEIPVSEWLVDEEDEEEDYAVEKIVDMRVLNPENTKKGGKKNEPGHVKHFHPFAQGGCEQGCNGRMTILFNFTYGMATKEVRSQCPYTGQFYMLSIAL
eukprot:SAG11_NODE_126_length_15729_cov_9.966859_9_plen_191_part_00